MNGAPLRFKQKGIVYHRRTFSLSKEGSGAVTVPLEMRSTDARRLGVAPVTRELVSRSVEYINVNMGFSCGRMTEAIVGVSMFGKPSSIEPVLHRPHRLRPFFRQDENGARRGA